MNDLINLVKNYAPALATALAGPAGGAVVSAIASKLGVSADVAAITQAIAQDPQAAQKLAEIDLEQFKVEAEDRDSARKRESEIATSANSPWLNKAVTPILALVIVTVWATVQYFMLNYGIPQENRELVARVLGTLDGALMVCLSYYFGASHKH
jgi:hypothetical protein